MLDLYKKLESQERGEKREKNVLKLNFLSFPSLFFLFSPLSFMSIFFFTYTREAAAIVFLCMFAYRKQETFLLYLRLYKKLYYSNFRIFLSRPNCMQYMVNFTFSFFEKLIQELVAHCHYYLVMEC